MARGSVRGAAAGAAADVALGDLVLAKFDEYPYWPAVVGRCFWRDSDYRGRWRLPAGHALPEDEGGAVPHERVWCAFIEDDSANWVPVTRIKRFDPRTARRWQCRRRTKNYLRQQAAIAVAEQMFAERARAPSAESTDASASESAHSSVADAPRPPLAAKRKFHDEDESAAAPKPRKVPRAADADSVSERCPASGKSRKVRVRPAWVARYAGSAACKGVPAPPERAAERGALQGDQFESVVKALEMRFADMRNALAAAYQGECDETVMSLREADASRCHAEIAAMLVQIADADVPLADLRRNMAGKLVSGIVKAVGRALPAIGEPGSEIIARWRILCQAFDEQVNVTSVLSPTLGSGQCIGAPVGGAK